MRALLALLLFTSPALACESYEADVAEAERMAWVGYSVYRKSFVGDQVPRLLEALALATQKLTPEALGQSPVTIDPSLARSILAVAYSRQDVVMLRFYGADGCMYANGQLPLPLWAEALITGGFQ